MNWPSNDTFLTKELPHLRLVTILQSSHPLDTNGDSSRHTARSKKQWTRTPGAAEPKDAFISGASCVIAVYAATTRGF